MTSLSGLLNMDDLHSPYTVNVTGETLVLNKNFPSIKQGFTLLLARKIVKIGFAPA